MEIKTVTQLVRLLGSVLLEGLVGVGHLLLFLFRRRVTRERIRALLIESRSPSPTDSAPERDDGEAACSGGARAERIPVGAGRGAPDGGAVLLGIVSPLTVAMGLLVGGLLVGGCAASPLEQQRTHGSPVPGTSFERQIQEVGESASMLADMSDAQGSLESDLQDFGSGTSVSEAASDLETLLLDPGSQRSLEDDLREFGKSDPESFWETLLMLGW